MRKPFTFLLFVFVSLLGKLSYAQNTACNAYFNVVYLNGNTIQFNPAITTGAPTTSHYWFFGDGSVAPTVAPEHNYLLSGAYTVKHLVIRRENGAEVCRDSFNRVVQVSAPCTLAASFVTTLNSAPLSVHFTNSSQPMSNSDSMHWNFGDGSSSTAINPDHIFPQAGTFNVCLRVQRRNNDGTLSNCVSEICHPVLVQATPPPACNLVANYMVYRDTTVANPYTFQFTNTSTPLHTPDSIRWTFGDGTSSNQFNPRHVYAQPGTYEVCLRVQQRNANGTLSDCIREICHPLVVVAPPACNLYANFIAGATTPTLTWQFTNTSVNIGSTDSIRWTFGDGSSSNQFNPVHSYAQAGTYNVCLRVQKRNSQGVLTTCVSEICHSFTVIDQNTCTLTANFTAHQMTPNFSWYFSNTSVGLTSSDSIKWSFGDGTYSNQLNPVHVYTHAGTFNVCLREQKRNSQGILTNCVSEVCHSIVVIDQNNCVLVANFTPEQNGTTAIHFVNNTAPISTADSIIWHFGDGSISHDLSPTHTYTQSGTFTVCLRVQKRNSNGTLSDCISEICHPVTVANTCNVQAHFNYHPDSLNHNLVHFVNFTNVTPATATWSFGDGSTASTWNADHLYAQPGRYYVCLRVELSPNCVSYSCDSITVPPAPMSPDCIHQSNFSIVRASGSSQLFYFVPAVINTTYQYTWSFGDGTGNHDITTSHQYAQPGMYTVCLTVYRNATCVSTTCQVVNAYYQVNCDTVHVNYQYIAATSGPNKIYFHAVSNVPVLDQVWTIARVPGNGTAPITIHQNNPYYIFQDTGYYHVCLHATTVGGCVKEYCETIHITQLAPNTNCTIQPYPNPATNEVSLNVFLAAPQMVNVYIYNSMGLLVKEKHQQGVAGNNIATIDISSLMPGLYTIRMIHGNDICYGQFVKL